MNEKITVKLPIGEFELKNISGRGFDFSCFHTSNELFNFNLPFDATYTGFVIRGYYNLETGEITLYMAAYGSCYERDKQGNFKYIKPTGSYQWSVAPELFEWEKEQVIRYIQEYLPVLLSVNPEYTKLLVDRAKEEYEEAVESAKSAKKQMKYLKGLLKSLEQRKEAAKTKLE